MNLKRAYINAKYRLSKFWDGFRKRPPEIYTKDLPNPVLRVVPPPIAHKRPSKLLRFLAKKSVHHSV